MVETNLVINAKSYYWDTIKSPAQAKDPQHADESYILQLIKYNLLCMYLEIQNSYTRLVRDDIWEKEQLYDKFFSEVEAHIDLIVKAEKLNLPSLANQLVVEPEVSKFTPREYDIRGVVDGILKYEDIIKDKQKFSAFESKLFDSRLINEQCDFIKAKNNVEELAAYIITIYHKNYFQTQYYPKGAKKIKPVDIRKFLEIRYNVSIDQQFRKWLREPEAHKEYMQTRVLYRDLPLC